MTKISCRLLAAALVALSLSVVLRADSTPTDAPPSAGQSLKQGWTLIQEGDGEATIEQDAKHPTSDSPHLLKLAVTKIAGPGKGRAGAKNSTPLAVEKDVMYDATFAATTQRGSVGLVISLETEDGKVLARTTQASFGAGRRGPPGGGEDPTAGRTWSKVTVALRTRAADKNARLTVVPIEPTTLWLDEITLTPRKPAQ
jgi:hypothetical protein